MNGMSLLVLTLGVAGITSLLLSTTVTDLFEKTRVRVVGFVFITLEVLVVGLAGAQANGVWFVILMCIAFAFMFTGTIMNSIDLANLSRKKRGHG